MGESHCLAIFFDARDLTIDVGMIRYKLRPRSCYLLTINVMIPCDTIAGDARGGGDSKTLAAIFLCYIWQRRPFRRFAARRARADRRYRVSGAAVIPHPLQRASSSGD